MTRQQASPLGIWSLAIPATGLDEGVPTKSLDEEWLGFPVRNHRRIRKPERPQHSSRVSKGSARSLATGEVTIRFRRLAPPMTGNR